MISLHMRAKIMESALERIKDSPMTLDEMQEMASEVIYFINNYPSNENGLNPKSTCAKYWLDYYKKLDKLLNKQQGSFMNQSHFHKGAAKAHLILAKQYLLNNDQETAKYHAKRAKEEVNKARAMDRKFKADKTQTTGVTNE